MEKNPVTHFELPAEDRKRCAKFYNEAFGWKTEELGKDMNNYVLCETTESDKETRPKNPGAINGGIYTKTDDMPAQFPSVVIKVDDIETHMKIIESVGGKVLGTPWDIPGVGKYVSFIDTEGNRNSMLQPREM